MDTEPSSNMMAAMKPLERSDLAFVPGPARVRGTMDSQSVQEVEQYEAEDVAKTLDELLGPRIVDGAGDWFANQWRWKSGRHFVDVGFTLLGDGLTWGGSPLQVYCTASEVVGIWRRLMRRYPGTWMHDADSTTMYSPAVFMRQIREGS